MVFAIEDTPQVNFMPRWRCQATLGKHHCMQTLFQSHAAAAQLVSQVGCSLVAYFVHVHERFTAQRIRWSLRANLLLVIGLVQLEPGLQRPAVVWVRLGDIGKRTACAPR